MRNRSTSRVVAKFSSCNAPRDQVIQKMERATRPLNDDFSSESIMSVRGCDCNDQSPCKNFGYEASENQWPTAWPPPIGSVETGQGRRKYRRQTQAYHEEADCWQHAPIMCHAARQFQPGQRPRFSAAGRPSLRGVTIAAAEDASPAEDVWGPLIFWNDQTQPLGHKRTK